MLDTGYSMLDKSKKEFLFNPVSRDQHLVSVRFLHHSILKLDINFKILAYIDT